MPGGPRPRITSPVAIDREDELAVFESTIDLALGGEPRTLIVAGEAGVGKTRLVEEATDSARARGMRVLRGGCLELGTQIPYLPFVQIMRTLLRELPPAELETVVG